MAVVNAFREPAKGGAIGAGMVIALARPRYIFGATGHQAEFEDAQHKVTARVKVIFQLSLDRRNGAIRQIPLRPVEGKLGNAFGHVAIEVADAYAACAQIKARGGKVVREAGPMQHGTTVIAFVEDPDGYKVELIQKKA